MLGGLSQFLDAEAKEMKNGFFQASGMPSEHERELSFSQRKPEDGFFEKEATKQKLKSEYTEFSGKVIDV